MTTQTTPERFCSVCDEPVDDHGLCEDHPDAELCPTCDGTRYVADSTWPTGAGRCWECNLPEGRCLG